jgi:AFG3 family protein
MIDLVGKRPFVGKADDMDKWLDKHRGERETNPPLTPETIDGPLPAPAATTTSLRS